MKPSKMGCKCGFKRVNQILPKLCLYMLNCLIRHTQPVWRSMQPSCASPAINSISQWTRPLQGFFCLGAKLRRPRSPLQVQWMSDLFAVWKFCQEQVWESCQLPIQSQNHDIRKVLGSIHVPSFARRRKEGTEAIPLDSELLGLKQLPSRSGEDAQHLEGNEVPAGVRNRVGGSSCPHALDALHRLQSASNLEALWDPAVNPMF